MNDIKVPDAPEVLRDNRSYALRDFWAFCVKMRAQCKSGREPVLHIRLRLRRVPEVAWARTEVELLQGRKRRSLEKAIESRQAQVAAFGNFGTDKFLDCSDSLFHRGVRAR